MSGMKNHCKAKQNGKRSCLLFPPLLPSMTVTVITFQSPLKEYFFAGQTFTKYIFTGNSCLHFGFCLLALNSKSTVTLWGAFILWVSTSSKVDLSPGEELFLILRDPSCHVKAIQCSKQNISFH